MRCTTSTPCACLTCPTHWRAGAAFRFLPDLTDGGTPGLEVVQLPDTSLVLKVPFDMKWPDSMPFLIRLEEKPGEMPVGTPLEACSEKFPADPLPPAWDATPVLTVYLPKGEQVRVRYSTFPGKDENGLPDLELLGVWQWLLEHPAADPGLLERYALNGAHWMISPYRTLTLVHAVQQPLCKPVIDMLGWMHTKGETFVTLGGRLSSTPNPPASSTCRLIGMSRWMT